MQEVNVSIWPIHLLALDAALKAALPTKVTGVSTYGSGRAISIWMTDDATAGDRTTATGICTAHDPVFLSVDKTAINADDTDAATVTVTAPGNPASVTLSVAVNGNAPADWTIALTSGVGSDTITSAALCDITVTVKNPANRSTDSIVISAA